MATYKVNGKVAEAPAGDKLLPHLIDGGTHVPHYCWHRGLTPAGNCRMCLVKVSNSRKLEVACMYPVSEGLEVTTEGPDVDAGRQAVLEYMLINHPLDCPVCDKAGECDLQDNTFKYRNGHSRFDENKVIRHTKDLGPNVKIWGNRCISCTRCVRFTEEITGTGELSIVNRGDHSVADVHPDVPLDNPMSLNVVDICPVGALIDKNFLYQARVWFSKKVPSVCTGCSRGCNITGTVLHNQVKRLQPRENHDVNGFWMCDAGRLDHEWLSGTDRLRVTKGDAGDLARRLVAVRDRNGAGSVAMLISTAATVEELHLAAKLAQRVQAEVYFLGKVRGARWVSPSGFAIETDKTPNTRGALRVFELDALPPASGVVDAIRAGRIKAVLSINGIHDADWPEGLVDLAPRLELAAALDVCENDWTKVCGSVLPSAAWAEKSGTFVNRDGRLQRIQPIVAATGTAQPDVVWLQQMLIELGERRTAISAEGVLREALRGIDYRQIGQTGVVLDAPSAPAGVGK